MIRTKRNKKVKNKFFYENLPLKTFEQYETKTIKKIDMENEEFTENRFPHYDQVLLNDNEIETEETKISDPVERKNYLINKVDKISMSHREITEIEQICEKFHNVFFIPGDDFESIKSTSYKIQIIPNTKPVNIRQYRVPQKHVVEMQKQINELLLRGIIEPSKSEWNSPVVLVEKKFQMTEKPKYRMCVDFRAVNKVVQKEDYPIPLLDDILDTISHKSQIFSKLDIFSAYHQIDLHPKSRQYCSFSTNFHKYHFKKLPFGLVNAGYVFCRTICNILKDLIGKNMFIFVDDIIIWSSDLETHIKVIHNVLKKLNEFNVKLKLDKCEFFKRIITFLGYEISEFGIKPSKEKTLVVERFPQPKSQRDVQRYLGLTSFFRRLVPNIAKISKPLYLLVRKNATFAWDEKCQEAFEKLKDCIINSVVLKHVDYTQPINIFTDASKIAIASVLTNGIVPDDKPVHFYSKVLNQAQQNYCPTELELLSVIMAFAYFRFYILGRVVHLYTDHKAIIYMLNSKQTSRG